MTEYNDDDDSNVVEDEEELLEGAEDDLDDNPFYRVFATHFRAEYNVLQEYGGILCVPHSALLYNVRITQPLVGLFFSFSTHIEHTFRMHVIHTLYLHCPIFHTQLITF